MVSLAVAVLAGLASGTLLLVLLAALPIPLLGDVVEPEQRSWVAKNVTQCSEPWDDFKPIEGLTKYDIYFNARGVRIYDVQYIRWASDDGGFCSACYCPSGSTLYLDVANSDVRKMISYGFIEKGPTR